MAALEKYFDSSDPAACWLWQGDKNGYGYGRKKVNGRRVGAHRLVYEALVGPIPEGMHLDHLCRNPACVNPAHLEPVTNQENTRRGILGVKARTGRCRHGHLMTEENSLWPTGAKTPQCRECKNAPRRKGYL